MASSLTSSDNQKSFKYQVFLSFRGEDTRKNFVDHLYASLTGKGIHTFRDNEELEKGKQIDQLFKAIEESRFFIIVFSKNYASSSWCLKEVTKIMECQDEKEQIAYPLFYDVEPSQIRYQIGPVGSAIAKYNSNEQIKKWEKALESAGNLVGWDLKNIANGHEAEAIKKIVKEISIKLRSIHLGNDENVVGMERRMKELESSLGIGLNDKPRMIGIKGMEGIGKTTLARAIFDQFSSHFEGSSFLEGVTELSEYEGLWSLQERVLSDVLNDKHMRVGSVHDGKKIMRTRLPYIKVLLVLDNVDNAKQLDALAGDWFKPGSRIIITTQDEDVLLSYGVNVKWIHEVSLLSDEEAMSLFCRHAFKRFIPDEGFEKISSQIVHHAAGLPVTIKDLGCSLCGKGELEWKDELDVLENIDTLKIIVKKSGSFARKGLRVLGETTVDVCEDVGDTIEEIITDIGDIFESDEESVSIETPETLEMILKSSGSSAKNGLRVIGEKTVDVCEDVFDSIEEIVTDIGDIFESDEESDDTEADCPEIVKRGFENVKEAAFWLFS